MYWVWLATAVLFVMFTGVVVAVGIGLFRSPEWDERLASIADGEVDRRGLKARKLTQMESVAHTRFLPNVSESQATDGEVDTTRLAWLLVSFIRVTIDDASIAAVIGDIRTRQQELLNGALRRQVCSVKNVSSLAVASRIWVAVRVLNDFMVSASGVFWVGGRTLHAITNIAKEYTTKLGVVAVFASQFYWLLSSSGGGVSSRGGSIDLASLVGKFILPLLCVWAMLVLAYRFLVAQMGSWRGWRIRRVARLVGTALGLYLVLLLTYRYGAVVQARLAGFYAAIPAGEGSVGMRLTSGGMAAAAAYRTLSFGAASIRLKGHTWGARTGYLGGAFLFSSVTLPFGFYVFKGAFAGFPIVASELLVGVGVLLFVVSSSLNVVDRWKKAQSLTRAGLYVPTRGFSRVLSKIWATSLVSILFAAFVPSVSHAIPTSILDLVAVFTVLGGFYVVSTTHCYLARAERMIRDPQIVAAMRGRTMVESPEADLEGTADRPPRDSQ